MVLMLKLSGQTRKKWIGRLKKQEIVRDLSVHRSLTWMNEKGFEEYRA